MLLMPFFHRSTSIAFLPTRNTRSVKFLSENVEPQRISVLTSAAATAEVTGVDNSGDMTSTMASATPEAASGEQYDAVVCGGGPAGLLSAIMLAKKDTSSRIAVYDRLPAPPNPSDDDAWSDVARFYLIGLGHRGQRALRKFGVFDEVEIASAPVVGRKDWSPGMTRPEDGVERIATDKPVRTIVLPRDKLVGVLRRHIVENFAHRIILNYGFEVVPVDFGRVDSDGGDDGLVTVSVIKCYPAISDGPSTGTTTGDDAECDTESSRVVRAKFLIGADGAARSIANEMERLDVERLRNVKTPLRRMLAPRPFQVTRYKDNNKRVYKTVPVTLPPDWRHDLNYSARSVGSRIVFEALPSDRNGTYCALLLLRADDKLAAPSTDATKLKDFFEEEFPQFGALIDDDDMDKMSAKAASDLPSFRYAGPRIFEGERTVLLGDCIHTVKPYYGLGANTALEDVVLLSEAIDEVGGLDDGCGAAVRLFSERRAGDAEAMVKISRNMDRPGKLGTLQFILPLILDGIFHRVFPRIFAPGIFSMFQRQDVTFRQIRRRKRIDRFGQLVFLAAVAATLSVVTLSAVRFLAQVAGTSGKVMGGAMLGSLAVVMILRRAAVSVKEGRVEAQL